MWQRAAKKRLMQLCDTWTESETMVDTDEIRYSFWLEKELEKNVKRLAGNV